MSGWPAPPLRRCRPRSRCPSACPSRRPSRCPSRCPPPPWPPEDRFSTPGFPAPGRPPRGARNAGRRTKSALSSADPTGRVVERPSCPSTCCLPDLCLSCRPAPDEGARVRPPSAVPGEAPLELTSAEGLRDRPDRRDRLRRDEPPSLPAGLAGSIPDSAPCPG